MSGKQVTFGDIDTKGGGDNIKERTITVDTILNKQLTILRGEIVDGYQGESMLLIYTKEYEKAIRTGSGVLIGKFTDVIKPHTDAGETVSTTITRVRSKKDASKSYYAFT